MGRLIYRSLLVFVVLELGLVAAARADQDPATQKALLHNKQARKLFNLGLFREAANEYEKAYKTKASPDFLYNLAQCHKRLDTLADLKKATFYLESYIKSAPFSPIRDASEQELKKLRQQIKAREEAEARKKKGPTPFYNKWWFWTGVGVVVAGVTTAAVVVAVQPDDPISGTADPGIIRLPLGRRW